MPTIVAANTNAACVMIGEKGADLIKEDYDDDGRGTADYNTGKREFAPLKFFNFSFPNIL